MQFCLVRVGGVNKLDKRWGRCSLK